MKNVALLLVFFIVFVLALAQEPIDDTIDTLAGATNETYSNTVDELAAASENNDHDEEDDD